MMKQFFFFLLCALFLSSCLLNKCEAKQSSSGTLNLKHGVLNGLMDLIHGGKQNNDEDNDDDDEGSSDGDARDYINGTQDVEPSVRAETYRSEINLVMQEKGGWVEEIKTDKTTLGKPLDKLEVNSKETVKVEFGKTYDKYENAVDKWDGKDVKFLKEVKDRMDKFGRRQTPLAQQNLAKVQSVTKVMMDSTPKLVEQINKRDGWGAVATVCTMVSGVTGVIPHPLGIIASTIFGLAAFFITLATSKTTKATDPYTRIYAKIDKAVDDIKTHDRKLELSRLIAPLAYSQRISEAFLRRGGKALSEAEFTMWSLTNNFPSIHTFVDSLSEISSYVNVMRKELTKDQTVKMLVIAYTQIAMMRDLLLADIANVIPEHESLESLREEYKFSLNRGKQASFQFLELLHKPTPEMLWSVGWYFPPTQNDDDVRMMNTYMKGLTYWDDAEDAVHSMPPAMVDAEILRLMKFKIKIPSANKYLTARYGYNLYGGYRLSAVQGDSHNSFEFEPTEYGYTKMIYQNVDNPDTSGLSGSHREPPKTQSNKMGISLNPDGYFFIQYENHRQKPKDFVSKDEFTIIPYNSLVNPPLLDDLTIMMGLKGDSTRFLGNYGDGIQFATREHVENMKEEEGNEKNPVLLRLIVQNRADVKRGIQSKYTDMAEAVDLGEGIDEMNENIHYCRLIGRCKVKN